MIKNDSVSGELSIGHRRRLKDRFLKSPIRSLPDYEILEMLLFNAIPRKDTKDLAKRLLKKFESLIAVISADPMELHGIIGVHTSVVLQFKLLLDLFSRLHMPLNSTKDLNIINNWAAVLNYCNLTMGFKAREHFRILFLNKRNVIIADELLETGTVDKVNVYPREIVKQALYHNASALILIHNHPSGEAKPSRDDIEITKKISEALSNINVVVHDHIIVAHHAHFSFKSNGFL